MKINVVKGPKLTTENNLMVDNTKTMASIGFQLIKTVKKINTTFEGILMNTYFVCVLGATCNFYSSTTILFNRKYWELYLLSAAYFAIALLNISRLVWVTSYCHNLVRSMKKCAHHLDRFLAKNVENNTKDVQLLQQELRYYSEAPINPFSAFDVSTSTFVGTFGTIITYLIVLIQFKVSEKTSTDDDANNNTETTTMTNVTTTMRSNVTYN